MFDVPSRTILMVVAGSRAYGIHTDASDVDIKGVAIAPREYVLGYLNRFEQADSVSHIAPFAADLNPAEQEVVRQTKLEGAIYELRKFMDLATQANPNILDALFCRDEEVRRLRPAGRLLRDSRDLFISAKARHTFSGYATAQLKRIETHRRWLISPPDHEPTRAEYDLPDRTVIPADQLLAAQAAIQKKLDSWEIDYGSLDEPDKIALQQQIVTMLADIHVHADQRFAAAVRAIGYDENFLVLLDRERRYKAARQGFEQYRTWKNTRNVDRAALEEKHGYDTKHGAHLYRLMKMCREILETGKVNVWRGDIDGDEIRSIRRGAWSYDRLVDWAKAEDLALTDLYNRKQYVVPHQPDRAALDRLCVRLMEEGISQAGG